MKTTQSTLSGGASVLASLGEDSRGGSRGRSPHRYTLLVALMFFVTLARAATNDLSGLLQKGLFEEEANRNLDAASTAYETLVKQFDKDRQLGATAVFRLGEVYRKQGKTNEAAAQYERIVRDFAEQTTLVTLSRQNLAGLNANRVNASATEAATVAPSGADAELLQRLKSLPRDQLWQVLPAFVPDPILTDLEKELNSTDARLREVRLNYSEQHPDVKQLTTRRELLTEKINIRLDAALAALEIRASLAKRAVMPSTNKISDAAAVAVTDDEDAEIRRIQAMIQNSPDLINAPSGDPPMTPLCRAARNGQLRVATFLLDGSAAIGRRSAGQTPLHYAASGGHRAMTEFLLQRGADANARDDSGRTALHLTADSGFRSVAEALIAAKADVNALSTRQETPLLLAAEKGHAELVRFLIGKGAELNIAGSGGFTPVIRAARRGHAETLTTLLAAKANPNLLDAEGRTALSHATEQAHFESVKALLAAQADPNVGAKSLPLQVAAYRKNPQIVEALLRAGADPNRAAPVTWQITDNSSLYGFGTSETLLSPLFMAVTPPSPEVVKLLLQFKANPNGNHPNGRPLIYSVLNQPELLAAFLDAGASPNAPSESDCGPLAAAQSAAAVKLLLAKGADVEARCVNRTPLMMAAYQNIGAAVEVAAALLQGGASVTARDAEGWTPLHWAANARNVDLVALLLTNRADVNARDKSGLTPLDLVTGPREKQQRQPWSSGLALFNNNALTEQTAALLRQRGGLRELPDFNSIRITRGTLSPWQAFRKDERGLNGFTLLEALLHFYNRPSYANIGNEANPGNLPFPDLSRIRVLRSSPSQPTERKEIVVNVLNATNGIDCTKDLPLEGGDLIEIPEREHTLAESPGGLTNEQKQQMAVCLIKTVRFVVRNEKAEVILAPHWAYLSSAVTAADVQKILRSSSDLSRVKVLRRGAKAGKPQEIVVDAQRFQREWSAEDLWLRDGDVIEVPDKL